MCAVICVEKLEVPSMAVYEFEGAKVVWQSVESGGLLKSETPPKVYIFERPTIADFDALNAEHGRMRRSIAQGLDCEPDDIEDRAREVTAALDRWYDFREECAAALECEEAPGAIVGAILDLKTNAHHDRAMRVT